MSPPQSTVPRITATRFCPMCGGFTNPARCVEDGAMTVERADAETEPPLTPGDVVDGRYRVVECIGRGSFGVVFRAEHIRTGQPVALKVLHVDVGRHEATQRFVKEGRALGRLRHAATVRIFDVGQVGEVSATNAQAPYIAMEFVDGPNLEQVLARLSRDGRALTEAQALDVVEPVLASLIEAHALGLIHRDLKPANILLTEVADEPLVVKVVDFGVVRTHDSDLTTRRSTIGTPLYMSPEQCRGETVDARSDLYSLGCLLFEAVCGVPPFNSKSHVDTMFLQMSAAVPDVRQRAITPVSDGFIAVLQRVLAKDPADRFLTARAMRTVVQALRREAWRNVPVTPMHGLIGVASGAAWRDIVTQDVVGTDAPTHAGVRSGVRGTTVSPGASGDTNATLAAIDVNRPETGQSMGPTRRSEPSRQPIETAALPRPARRGRPKGDDAGEFRLPSRPAASRRKGTPPPLWSAGDPVDGAAQAAKRRAADAALPFDASPSQDVVALPSRQRLDAAIAAAQRGAARRAAIRSEAYTRIDPADQASARDNARHVQVAPDGRSARKVAWASGTLLGTGIPTEDDVADE